MTMLELCDSTDSRYPDHFQAFLDSCADKHSKTFSASDYLFAGVYFIVLECGFSPLIGYDDNPFRSSHSFDIRKMRSIKSYYPEHMKLQTRRDTVFWTYTILLSLGNYSYQSELHGVPTADSTYLIVNFFLKHTESVRSLCLNVENYTEEINDTANTHKLRLKNLRELSLTVKDKLANLIQQEILLEESQCHGPHLLRLPERVQRRIAHLLAGNPSDLQYLASTCTYFYNTISSDSELWASLTQATFSSSEVKRARQEVPETEPYMEKKIFVNLKLKKSRRPYPF